MLLQLSARLGIFLWLHISILSLIDTLENILSIHSNDQIMGLERWLSSQGSFLLLQRAQIPFSSPMSSAYNCNAKGPSTFFWLPREPALVCTCLQTDMHKHMHIIFKNIL